MPAVQAERAATKRHAAAPASPIPVPMFGLIAALFSQHELDPTLRHDLGSQQTGDTDVSLAGRQTIRIRDTVLYSGAVGLLPKS